MSEQQPPTTIGQEGSSQPDSACPISADVRRVIDGCLSQARDLLQGAQVVQQAGLAHIAYHLAALALEEIGKADIVGMSVFAAQRQPDRDWLAKQAEDHVRKLFFALWGPSFGGERITSRQIEEHRGLARYIHETRQRGLYASVTADEGFGLPRDAVSEEDAGHLIRLAEARLGLAGCRQFGPLTPQQQDLLRWFLEATDDPAKRALIFGNQSMEKLVELGGVHEWIPWLKDQFDQAEAEGRRTIERELARPLPEDVDFRRSKWRLTIRFYSASHAIRRKPFDWWNQRPPYIQIKWVSKKDQFIVEFSLPDSVPLQGLWWAGWVYSRRFITALNIGSMGFFWWYVPEQVSRYYEKIIDLETEAEIGVERSPALRVDWGRQALSEQDLRNTALCFGMLPRSSDPQATKPFDHYLTGLGFLSKTDVHMRFEANAFEAFYHALKAGMCAYDDWLPDAPYAEAFHAIVAELKLMPETEDRRKYLELGDRLAEDASVAAIITLEEAAVMKLLCDAYFMRTFRRLAGMQPSNLEDSEQG